MLNNVMRMSGLQSGMDVQSMVQQLMRAESQRMVKLQQKRQIVEWRQQAYRDMAGVLKNFQTRNLGASLGGLKMPSTFGTIKAAITTSAPGVAASSVKVVNDKSALIGKQTLTVYSVAKKDAYVGEAKRTLDGEAHALATLADGDKFFIRLNEGTERAISFTMPEIATALTGGAAEADIATLVNKKLADEFGFEYDETDLANGILTPTGNQKVTFKSNGDGTFSFVAGKGQTVTVGSGGSDADGNSIDALGKLGFGEVGRTGWNAGADIVGSQTLKINGTDIEINYDAGSTPSTTNKTALNDVVSIINQSGAGVVISYDAASAAYKLESAKTGVANGIKITDPDTKIFLRDKLGIDLDSLGVGGTTKQTSKAADAIVNLNGGQHTFSENNFMIQGLNITITDASLAQGSNMSTFELDLTREVETGINAIKQFVAEYNSLVELLSGASSTSRAKNGSKGQFSYYDPLTDDQKKEMSDREVEVWETKAKQGLLYRDDIVTRLQSQMRALLYKEVNRSDGTKIALYQIGVTTSSESQSIGKLQIDETKLRAMLENDSVGVQELFANKPTMAAATYEWRQIRLFGGVDKGGTTYQPDNGMGLAWRLDDLIKNVVEFGGTIYTKAGLAEAASARTNLMAYEMEGYERSIADMMVKLARKENNYYMMFSRMENAIAKSNQQMDALMSSMSGG